ncbi:rCG44367 [Rattus norvegicus]|uniref:RCG44367 n=1 Tax=Rattus norvegicus TaxID=10116 RepID=A6I4H6_RAT|nr:rCG44367 [Rattus norvegicus]
MPTLRHFLRRQYWHWLRWCWSMGQFLLARHVWPCDGIIGCCRWFQWFCWMFFICACKRRPRLYVWPLL